jgi:nitronate monooxygenase
VPLPRRIADALSLPAFCAPMFLVSTPQLVAQACLAGLVGGLPRHNARGIDEFEQWLRGIRDTLDRARDETPSRRIGPIAVNISSRMPAAEADETLALCARHGVEIIVNATGDPTQVIQRSHDHGMLCFADAINMRFAHKAMAAGADGLNLIGHGGGGHSGTLNHFAFVSRVRAEYDGAIVLGGGISTGAGIRAAQVLGADLAYMGTRFIAARESGAPDAYKAMLVDCTSADLRYTAAVSGVSANWLAPSLRNCGIDPDSLPAAGTPLPEGAIPWKTLWSAGQGIDQIHDVPDVATLCARLADEYRAASRHTNQQETP